MAKEASVQIKSMGWELNTDNKANKAIEQGAVPEQWIATMKKASSAAEKAIADSRKARQALDSATLPDSRKDKSSAIQGLVDKVVDLMPPVQKYVLKGEFGKDKNSSRAGAEVGSLCEAVKQLGDQLVEVRVFVEQCNRR